MAELDAAIAASRLISCETASCREPFLATLVSARNAIVLIGRLICNEQASLSDGCGKALSSMQYLDRISLLIKKFVLLTSSAVPHDVEPARFQHVMQV